MRDIRSRDGERLVPFAIQDEPPTAGTGGMRTNGGAAPTKQQKQSMPPSTFVDGEETHSSGPA
jgi:hypothetical protein